MASRDKEPPAQAPVPPEAIESLRASLRGPVLLPGDHGYDDARKIWNAMIDRHPALIARCKGAADVIDTVNIARGHGLPISTRGGAHNVAGHAVCDDGKLRHASETENADLFWALRGGAGNYDRLARIKRTYDPGNLFRFNQNIRPAS